MKQEDKERFAERVIRLADMFVKNAELKYDSLIQGYWDAVHNSMELAEFEQVCDELTREMYTLPVPKQILDRAFRSKNLNQDQEQEKDPQLVHDERVLFEGQNLLKLMDSTKLAGVYRKAKMDVHKSLGDFAPSISKPKIADMVETRAAQIAWEQENNNGQR